MQIKRKVQLGQIHSRRKQGLLGSAGKDKSVWVLFRMNQETVRNFQQ